MLQMKIKISLFVFLSFTFCLRVQSQNDYKDFIKEVNKIYNDLTLNDVALKDVQVELANYPAGIAFAYINPKNNKRYILVNYSYVFNEIWLDPENINIRNDLIKGILTHEWSHHFLNHNLYKSNVLNERNADILAGRILADKSNKVNIESVIAFYNRLPKDNHHLPDSVRKELLYKGKQTYEIATQSLEDLCKNIERDAKEKMVLEKTYLTNQLNTCNNIQKYDQKILIISQQKKTSNLLLKDKYISLLSSDSLKYSETSFFDLTQALEIDSLIIQYKTLTNKYMDSLINKNKIVFDGLMKQQNLLIKKSLDSLQNISIFPACFQFKNKIDKLIESQFVSDTSILTEAYYNKWYIEQNRKNAKNKKSDKCYNNYLTTLDKVVTDTLKKFSYRLNGGIKIVIDYFKNSSVKPVTITVKDKNPKSYDFIKSNEVGNFIGSFEIRERSRFIDKFYLDKNFHLWTETICAKSIDNKLYLERHKTIKP